MFFLKHDSGGTECTAGNTRLSACAVSRRTVAIIRVNNHEYHMLVAKTVLFATEIVILRRKGNKEDDLSSVKHCVLCTFVMFG